MDFSELRVEEAEWFRDYVTACAPFRLDELRTWLLATDGPLNALDGSLASLVPLWKWVVDLGRDDLTALVGERYAALAIANGATVPNAIFYASEAITHYVFETLQGIDPEARRDILRKKKGQRVENEFQNQTGMVVHGRWNRLDPETFRFLKGAYDEDRLDRDPERLVNIVRSFFQVGETVGRTDWEWPQTTGAPPDFPVLTASPVAAQDEPTKTHSPRRDLTIVFPAADGSAPASLEPFTRAVDPHATSVDSWLREPTASQLILLAGGLTLEGTIQRGQFTLLMETPSADDAEWARITTALTGILRPAGATIRDGSTNRILRGRTF